MTLGNDISNDDRALLSAYIDDELPAEQQQALEARLAQEPTLRQELESLRTVVRALQGLPDLTAPRDFTVTPDMVADDQERSPVIRFPMRVVSTLSGAAAVLLVSVGLFLLLASSSQQMEDTAVVQFESAREVAVQPTQTAQAVPQAESLSQGDDIGAAGDMARESAELDAEQEETTGVGAAGDVAQESAEMDMEQEESAPIEDDVDEGAADEAFASPATTPLDESDDFATDDAPQAAPQMPPSMPTVLTPVARADTADGLAMTPEDSVQRQTDAEIQALDDDVSVSVITSVPTLRGSRIASPENDSTPSGIPMTGVSEPVETLVPEVTPRPVTDSRWLGLSLIGLGVVLAGISAGAALRLRRRDGGE